MFSATEKLNAYSGNGTNVNYDKSHDLGSLGLTQDAFKCVVSTLMRRSDCLFLPNQSRQPRNLVPPNTTQKMLSGILGPNKPRETGGSCGSENKLGSSRNNLKVKIDAEEAAIKSVFRVMARMPASEDNPLKSKGVVMPINPWSAPTEEQLEYIFREGVSLDATNLHVRHGRYLADYEAGSHPFLLSVRLEIRVLQCLLLNFSWFGNRLFKVMKELNVESMASARELVGDPRSNGWADMNVRHFIRTENVSVALRFLSQEYNLVHESIKQTGKTPTYFAIDFVIVDNAIGLADSGAEHQGSAYVEWKCFNRKPITTSGEFGTNESARLSVVDNVLLGRGRITDTMTSVAAVESEEFCSAAAAPDIINFGRPTETGRGSLFDSAKPIAGCDPWMKSIMVAGAGGDDEGRYERFRCGSSTVSIDQTSSVSLAVMAKSNECKWLVNAMIKFLEEAAKAIDDCSMYSDDYVFCVDQGENYEHHKDLYLAAICSNPANIYRVMSHLFANLLMPRLRNPVQRTTLVSNQSLGVNGRQWVNKEYGRCDMQYGTPQFARGKLKVSAKRSCDCRKQCKDARCFDSSRLSNNRGSIPDPPECRFHNSHRSNAFDFRFYDELRDKAELQTGSSKKFTRTVEYDFLAQDSAAFDLLTKCFSSAGLHHIFCSDVLMVHRGDNFNIDIKNNKLECMSNEKVTSSQVVNVKEAISDITSKTLKRGSDIVDYMQKQKISLREFSVKLSKAVRNFNELTSNLCDSYRRLDKPQVVLSYVFQVMPFLGTILSVVDIEELQKPYKDLEKCSLMQQQEPGKHVKLIFKLFDAIVKFCLNNYNASVTAAINRRGYLTNTAAITGYRFQFNGDGIIYHETIAAVSSCIAFADYYSSRAVDSKDGAGIDDRLSNLNENVASLFGLSNEQSVEEDPKRIAMEKSAAFMKLYAAALLGHDEVEEDKGGCGETSMPHLQSSPSVPDAAYKTPPPTFEPDSNIVKDGTPSAKRKSSPDDVGSDHVDQQFNVEPSFKKAMVDPVVYDESEARDEVQVF